MTPEKPATFCLEKRMNYREKKEKNQEIYITILGGGVNQIFYSHYLGSVSMKAALSQNPDLLPFSEVPTLPYKGPYDSSVRTEERRHPGAKGSFPVCCFPWPFPNLDTDHHLTVLPPVSLPGGLYYTAVLAPAAAVSILQEASLPYICFAIPSSEIPSSLQAQGMNISFLTKCHFL